MNWTVILLLGYGFIGGLIAGFLASYLYFYVRITDKEKVKPEMMPIQPRMVPPSKGTQVLAEISPFAPKPKPQPVVSKPARRPILPSKATSWKEPKPEPKPEAKPEPKPEAKPEVKSELKPNTNEQLPPIDWGNK